MIGIAAGNGRASGGVSRGVAYESELLVVKMGNARENSFPRTTELMEGIDYLVRQAVKLGKPIAINTIVRKAPSGAFRYLYKQLVKLMRGGEKLGEKAISNI